ncbi:MAG: hypothetical protein HKM04_06205 [Legionellales bacterium]|nr:hypothetical protein [Legionellales bacterium]
MQKNNPIPRTLNQFEFHKNIVETLCSLGSEKFPILLPGNVGARLSGLIFKYRYMLSNATGIGNVIKQNEGDQFELIIENHQKYNFFLNLLSAHDSDSDKAIIRFDEFYTYDIVEMLKTLGFEDSAIRDTLSQCETDSVLYKLRTNCYHQSQKLNLLSSNTIDTIKKDIPILRHLGFTETEIICLLMHSVSNLDAVITYVSLFQTLNFTTQESVNLMTEGEVLVTNRHTNTLEMVQCYIHGLSDQELDDTRLSLASLKACGFRPRQTIQLLSQYNEFYNLQKMQINADQFEKLEFTAHQITRVILHDKDALILEIIQNHFEQLYKLQFTGMHFITLIEKNINLTDFLQTINDKFATISRLAMNPDQIINLWNQIDELQIPDSLQPHFDALNKDGFTFTIEETPALIRLVQALNNLEFSIEHMVKFISYKISVCEKILTHAAVLKALELTPEEIIAMASQAGDYDLINEIMIENQNAASPVDNNSKNIIVPHVQPPNNNNALANLFNQVDGAQLYNAIINQLNMENLDAEQQLFLDQAYVDQQRANFEKNAAQATLLPISLNSQKLEAICFDDNLIPERFLCSVMKEIMDDPVIDGRNENCILYFLNYFSKNAASLQSLKNSYVLAQGKLYYVDPFGDIEQVAINDFNLFREKLLRYINPFGTIKLVTIKDSEYIDDKDDILNLSNNKKVSLSKEHIVDLITSNSDHTCYNQVMERAVIERALIEKKVNPYSNMPLEKEDLQSVTLLKAQIDAFVQKAESDAAKIRAELLQKLNVNQLNILNFTDEKINLIIFRHKNIRILESILDHFEKLNELQITAEHLNPMIEKNRGLTEFLKTINDKFDKIKALCLTANQVVQLWERIDELPLFDNLPYHLQALNMCGFEFTPEQTIALFHLIHALDKRGVTPEHIVTLILHDEGYQLLEILNRDFDLYTNLGFSLEEMVELVSCGINVCNKIPTYALAFKALGLAPEKIIAMAFSGESYDNIMNNELIENHDIISHINLNDINNNAPNQTSIADLIKQLRKELKHKLINQPQLHEQRQLVNRIMNYLMKQLRNMLINQPQLEFQQVSQLLEHVVKQLQIQLNWEPNLVNKLINQPPKFEKLIGHIMKQVKTRSGIFLFFQHKNSPNSISNQSFADQQNDASIDTVNTHKLESIDHDAEQIPEKFLCNLTNQIMDDPVIDGLNDIGCLLYFFLDFPAKDVLTESLTNSYVLAKSKLYYVNCHGDIELVKLNDFDLFREKFFRYLNPFGMNNLAMIAKLQQFGEDSKKVFLSKKLVVDLITSNGEHTHYHNVMERAVIEKILETNESNPLLNLPLKKEDLQSVPHLKAQLNSFVQQVESAAAKNEEKPSELNFSM